MMSSLVGLSVSACAAPQSLLSNTTVDVQTAALQPAATAPTPISFGAPLNLLTQSGAEACDASAKICAVRLAAERRAAEVVAAESGAGQHAEPRMRLLIPVASRQNPSVAPEPLAPNAPQQPVVPVPPAPDLSIVPEVKPVPESTTPPIASDSESVIKPPRTGDADIVKRPPRTGSQMPVTVPKPEPLVVR